MSDNKSAKPESSKNKNKRSKEKAEVVIMDKLKILALHGYRQNGDSFKSKIGSFRKFVNKYCEIVFVTAPHKAPPMPCEENEAEQEQQDQRSWWFNKYDGTFKGTNRNGPAFGYEDSLRLVESTWKEQGPFQGLLGFSQGACFVGLLCDLSSRGMTCIKPEFAILSSGFRSGSLVHLSYYENTIDIPTLHVFGDTDEIIPKDMSLLLSETFTSKEILLHPGGHYFPATAQQKPIFIEFIQNRLQDYLERKELENSDETNTIVVNDENSEEDK